MLLTGLRPAKLDQNQFGYEDQRVLDVVMQGHREMWQAMQGATRSTPIPEPRTDFMHAAELESGSPNTAATTPRRVPPAS